MAHKFAILDHTTTLIDFMDANHGIVSYEPGFNGEEESITETATVWVKSTTDSGLSASLTAIQDAFDLAERRRLQGELFYRVYLAFSPNGADDGYTPLRSGSIIAIEDMIGVPWAELTLKVTMQFVRDNYWEGNTETCTMTNMNGTSTSSIVVYNNNDLSGSSAAKTFRNNFLSLLDKDGLSFPEDLSPTASVIINPQNGKRIAGVHCIQYSEDRIRQKSSAYPAARGWFEGEDSTGGTTTTGAPYSGAAYGAFSVSTGTTGKNMRWSIASYYASEYNRVLCSARFSGTIRFRPYVEVNGKKSYGATVIYTGTNTWNIYDLGIMKIPPMNIGSVATIHFASIYLGLNAVCVAGTTLNLDWITGVPIQSYCYALIENSYALGSTVTPGQQTLNIEYFHDDLLAYVLTPAGILGKSTINGRLRLTPNRKNFIHFIWQNDSGINAPQEYTGVTVNYRPRWRYFHAS